MRIAWVLGWSVPEGWFAPFAREARPEAEHVFFEASPRWREELAAGGPWAEVVGYSLGALLLLEVQTELAGLAPRVTLLAPVFAFPREEGCGGRVARAQVRYLAKWLKTDPEAAQADFYARAGLVGCEVRGEGMSVETLHWGLEKLVDSRVEPALPTGWSGYVGLEDALIDGARLQALDPAIRVVAGATHHPAALLRAWAGDSA